MDGRWLRLGGSLVALPATLIALAVFGTATIERNSALHAATAQGQAQALLTAMLDQETGARGFFQTSDPVFLEPWDTGTQSFATTFRAATRTDAGHAGLERLLHSQDVLAAAWHHNAQAAIDGLRFGGIHPTVTEALGRKAEMDAFRNTNTAFSQELAVERNSALNRASLISVLVVVGLAVIITLGSILLWSRRSGAATRRRQGEAELRELLQASESENESRQLVIRHIERIIPGAGAAVLNRNNSDDRLEPSLSANVERTPLRDLTQDARTPRACLAVRLSRSYARGANEDTLAACEVCGALAADIACEPLLVGGKVIGAVLVAAPGRIAEDAHGQLRDAVIQAAPIIANQRNLSIAETRAASDPLTGLPNRRAADATLKRMVAQAGRSVSPLAALLLDLDHFKKINDGFGHDKGDQALAAVGHVLTAVLRGSDFAARYGGEEFLVLLPGTSREQAAIVAEKIRVAIGAIDGSFGPLSASLGVATIPEDAADGDSLVRSADRALYIAKRNGRDQVAFAVIPDSSPEGERTATPLGV